MHLSRWCGLCRGRPRTPPCPRSLPISFEDEDDDNNDLSLCGLDVHEHVCDAGLALLDCRLYSMRDLVPLMYGNVSVHADVKIDVIIQAHLARMAFLHLDDTGD